MAQHVYSPLDHVSEFKHNGIHYPLRPNQTTEIVSKTKGVTDAQVAEYAVSRLGKWGVCLTKGPVVKAEGKGVAGLPEDQEIVDKAEETYLAAMREWAETVVIADSKENAPRVKAGLAPKHTEEWKRADAWLKKNPEPPPAEVAEAPPEVAAPEAAPPPPEA